MQPVDYSASTMCLRSCASDHLRLQHSQRRMCSEAQADDFAERLTADAQALLQLAVADEREDSDTGPRVSPLLHLSPCT